MVRSIAFLPAVVLSFAGAPLSRSQEPNIELSYSVLPTGGAPQAVRFLASAERVRVLHESALESCCLDFLPFIDLEGGTLTITETNQGPPCGCADSPVTLSITVAGLPPGSYVVLVQNEGGHLIATASVDVLDAAAEQFLRGRVNEGDVVDLSDAIYVLKWLGLGGPAPPCFKAADVNDDGTANLSDAIYLLGYLFLGSPAPPPPFATAGFDPTPDNLPCAPEAETIERLFVRSGDFDGDGQHDDADDLLFLDFLLQGVGVPACKDALDANDDGVLTVDDLCLFSLSSCPSPHGGNTGQLAEPQVCGLDSTPDKLGCAYSGCPPGF